MKIDLQVCYWLWGSKGCPRYKYWLAFP